MIYRNLKAIFFSLLMVSGFLTAEIRATIDVGSGGPKLLVAHVDLTTQKIVEIFHSQSYYVPFQQELSKSFDNTFNQKIIDEGLVALKEAISTARSLGAEKIVAVATAAFRSADNGKAYAEQIQTETGVKVFIIDQTLEAELGFKATLASVEQTADDLVVWDIGGGSMQFIGEKEGNLFIDRSPRGAVAFRNYILKEIQLKDPQLHKSPNPLSHSDISQAIAEAHILAKNIDPSIKELIQKPSTQVIGIGNAFTLCIASLLDSNPFTQKELSTVVTNLEGKHDTDFGDDPGRHVISGNAIFTLGFMEELGINNLRHLNVNNADGVLIHSPFWE